MNKLIMAMLICMMGFAVPVQANSGAEKEYGVQWSAGGKGLGFTYRTEKILYGVFAGGTFNDADSETSKYTFGGWVGKRKLIADNIHFNIGVEGYLNTGEINGVDIDSSYEFGPFVSIHYYINDNWFMSSWVNPVFVSSQELDGSDTVTTVDLFLGGVGVGYLF